MSLWEIATLVLVCINAYLVYTVNHLTNALQSTQEALAVIGSAVGIRIITEGEQDD